MRYHACGDDPDHVDRMAREAQPKPPAESVLKLWSEYVRATPNIFRRLAFLASLRDDATGRYSHYRLRWLLGDEATDRFLREQHRSTFADWLALNLEQQHSDFECFLSTAEGHRRQILVMCAVLTPHAWYVPRGVPEHESRLFLADFAALLELLYVKYGLIAAERDKESALERITDYCALW